MPNRSEALYLSGKGIGNTVSSNDLSANGTGWKVNRYDTPGTVFTEHVSTEKFPPTIWLRVAYFALHHLGFLKSLIFLLQCILVRLKLVCFGVLFI